MKLHSVIGVKPISWIRILTSPPKQEACVSSQFKRIARSALRKISILKSDQNGSAVVEFVLIATPLFIPAILFFNAMQNSAKEEMNTSYIARQAVRAFATAPDQSIGNMRIRRLLDEFTKLENKGLYNGNTKNGFSYEISCSTEDCFTPGTLIELKLFREIPEVNGLIESRNRNASTVARTYVDKWRNYE